MAKPKRTKPRNEKKSASHLWLALEFFLLFIGLPLILYTHGNRLNVAITLWAASLYGAFLLLRERTSWGSLWRGNGWEKKARNAALARFLIALPLIILLTVFLMPNRLFMLPIEKPVFWLLIILLYPLLSVLPQELLFRSFFFRRYAALFPSDTVLIFLSALSFSFVHIIFHNFISPALCLIAGLLFSYSYTEHRSLKWALIEHSAYGCLVFTAGIGSYFLIGGIRP